MGYPASQSLELPSAMGSVGPWNVSSLTGDFEGACSVFLQLEPSSSGAGVTCKDAYDLAAYVDDGGGSPAIS